MCVCRGPINSDKETRLFDAQQQYNVCAALPYNADNNEGGSRSLESVEGMMHSSPTEHNATDRQATAARVLPTIFAMHFSCNSQPTVAVASSQIRLIGIRIDPPIMLIGNPDNQRIEPIPFAVIWINRRIVLKRDPNDGFCICNPG